MIHLASKLPANLPNHSLLIPLSLLLLCIIPADTSCVLPTSWAGKWNNHQQNSFNKQQPHNNFNSAFYPFFNSDNAKNNPATSRQIDSLSFLDKGSCLNFKDERYFFFDKSEKCFRCLFIIQRHYNVLQYKETDCYTDLNNFDELCSFLAPDLPLYTMIRDEAVPEKCPLTDSYDVLTDSDKNFDSDITLTAIQASLKTLAETSNKCLTRNDDSNVITKCSDMTMLRMDFKDCNRNYQSPVRRHKRRHHERGYVARCIGHWSEGNWNYLIIKQDQSFVKHQPHQSSLFRCMVYKDLDRPFKNTQANSLINPTNNLIKVSLSDDELCRDFYASSNSFVLKKNKRRDLPTGGDQKTCVFPRFLNKKWTNLKQTKLAFSMHRSELHILNMNNQTSQQASNKDATFLKLNCMQELAKNFNDDSVFLVSNFFECSTSFNCLAINQKSEFIVHLKHGHYNGHQCLFDRKNLIYEDYFSIETDTGISCPFSDRIYQLSDDLASPSTHQQPSSTHQILKRSVNSQFNLIYNTATPGMPKSSSSTCEHLLKIGCHNAVNPFNDYSINKKCQYSFSDSSSWQRKKNLVDEYSYESLPQYQALMRRAPPVLPVIESESSRICLASWPVNQNLDGDKAFIVLSKSTNSAGFRVGCSLWESFDRSQKLKISDDYMFKLCGEAVDPNEIYHRSANEFNQFYESSSKLLEDSSYVFEYRGTCRSGGQSQAFNKISLVSVLFVSFLSKLNILK